MGEKKYVTGSEPKPLLTALGEFVNLSFYDPFLVFSKLSEKACMWQVRVYSVFGDTINKLPALERTLDGVIKYASFLKITARKISPLFSGLNYLFSQ